MIDPTSRYANSSVVIAKGQNGNDTKVIVPSTQVAYAFQYSYYTVCADDTVQSIAGDFLGDTTLWWAVADANPEIMDWSQPLTTGYQLRIPALQAG